MCSGHLPSSKHGEVPSHLGAPVSFFHIRFIAHSRHKRLLTADFSFERGERSKLNHVEKRSLVREQHGDLLADASAFFIDALREAPQIKVSYFPNLNV